MVVMVRTGRLFIQILTCALIRQVENTETCKDQHVLKDLLRKLLADNGCWTYCRKVTQYKVPVVYLIILKTCIRCLLRDEYLTSG